MDSPSFCKGLHSALCLAIGSTRAPRKVFFLTRTPQGGFSCRFAAIHLLSSGKTIKIYLRRARRKVCDAFFSMYSQYKKDEFV